MKQRPCVILLHGLGESEMRMWPISYWLTFQGYRVVNVPYPSTLYPVEQLAEEYIEPLLGNFATEPVLHMVTHSMGGLLLRYCLLKQAQPNLKRVVMLTPANEGSETFEVYRHHPLFTMLYGPAGEQSGVHKAFSFPRQIGEPDINFDLGIVAGCISLDPVSFLVTPSPHDGRTSVEGTKMDGMTDHIVIPSTHEFVSYHPLAVYQTIHFLEHGQFNHAFALS